MNKNNLIYIKHILESIQHIENFTKTHTLFSFIEHMEAISAVAFQTQVLGEAASKIATDFKQAHPDVPWIEMIRTRHKIVHHYMEIDPEILWDIIEKELPKLKQQLHLILEEL